MVKTVTVTVTVEGTTDEVAIPTGLVDRLSEPGEPAAEVVADVLLMSFAGRAHALVHHDEAEPGDELVAIETDVMDRFEERFGLTYGEATGHSH